MEGDSSWTSPPARPAASAVSDFSTALRQFERCSGISAHAPTTRQPIMEQEPDPPPALPSAGPRELIHKLNNLLTVILARAEASLATDDTDEMRRALEIIVSAANSMADATRAYSHANLASRNLSLDTRPVDGA
jgi:hypothetical protein